MKKLLPYVLGALLGWTFLALVFLPVCPVQFQIRQEVTHSGRKVYPVYGRKLPFLEWKKIFANPESEEEAKNWTGRQRHWFPLLKYSFLAEKILPLDALPIPRI